ncbi:MAG: class I SAM-dependent methyltransferase [Maioricimonas sp. JB045]|uniref:class I SAM-dependent methyltransferase n=1 Tax=Maioricimonas sp. JC845 TaxID=3232138 RepID=UPI00345AFA96
MTDSPSPPPSDSSATTAGFQQQVRSGDRFEFGRNWQAFLTTLDDERIARAEQSLRDMLRVESLESRRFLDIGSGSGLFSLAARRLGATVHSFDFDPQSVACAEELRNRYFAGDDRWTIERGSVLDARYVESLGPFDIVYSWGVLHHTGDMWLALENAAKAVGDAGQLFIAIYNQQGYKSRWWLRVKQIYCSGLAGRALICALFVPYFWATTAAASVVLRRNLFAERKKDRGMSIWHDWIDWLGGLPFEVARPEEIFDFYRDRGFELQSLKTTNGLGNNEFVFGRR